MRRPAAPSSIAFTVFNKLQSRFLITKFWSRDSLYSATCFSCLLFSVLWLLAQQHTRFVVHFHRIFPQFLEHNFYSFPLIGVYELWSVLSRPFWWFLLLFSMCVLVYLLFHYLFLLLLLLPVCLPFVVATRFHFYHHNFVAFWFLPCALLLL